jgi:hypothetical protein
MRAFVVVAIVAGAGACRRSPAGPTLDVAVFAGDAPLAGATVVSYRSNGAEIDLQSTDPTGRVALAVAPDALIGIGFGSAGGVAQYATLPVPSGIAELDVHGPPAQGVSTIAGVVTVAPQQAIAADAYDVELGCAIRRVTALPATIEVPSPCQGSDTDLDVVVIAYASGAIIGWASTAVAQTGPLPFDAGDALFAPATWQPPPTPTIANDAGATLAWAVTVDGLPYAAPPGTDWGLATDGAKLVATLGSGDTSQVTSFAQYEPDVVAADFLAPIAPSLALDDRATLALHGGACDPSTSAATNVRVTWNAGTAVVWDVVMPPGPIAAAFPPAFDAPPAGAQLVTIERCVIADLATFDALVAAGVYLDDPASPSRITAPRAAPSTLKSTQTSDAL